tara:strand:- start:280 stop:573 length:294 start_codon:yes stop_codon:yes gene_type:complete
MSQENEEKNNNQETMVNVLEDIEQYKQSEESIENKNAYQKKPKWVNNQGEELDEVFGFNENAELVNGRAAMFGFFMLILTELVFKGEAATKSIFGIG